VLPGLIARSLWGDELASSPDQAYPMLVTRLLPAGLSGLMIAALLAALISSLAAVFNSSSTLFTMDIYKKLHPNVSDRQMVKVGRLATLGIIVIGIMWIPLIRHMSNQLYQYLQSVQAYISPPIAAVFLAGILWRKATSKAAITTLIAGGVLGLLKFAADIISKFTENEFIADFASISFLNYCVLLFLFCVAMIVVISKLSAGAESKDISRIIITDLRKVRSGDRMWNIVNVAMSVMIALTIISLWYHFA